MSSKASPLPFLVAFNIQLIIEILRRFVSYDDYLLVVGDTITLTILVVVLLSREVSYWWRARELVFFGSPLLLWIILSALSGHQSAMLLAIGLRPVVMLLANTVLSTVFFAEFQLAALRHITRLVGGWTVIMLATALAQLYLGQEHQINQIEQTGISVIADYTIGASGYGVEGFFRPSSIFLHTAKYGQVCFLFTAFLLVSLAIDGFKSRRSMLILIAAIASSLVTGQRAIIVFGLGIVGVALYIKSLRQSIAGSILSLVNILIATTIISIPFALWDYEIFELAIERLGSGFSDVPDRLESNLFGASTEILSRYWFIGEGAGFYSLGSMNYGGFVLSELAADFKEAENSYLRIIAEVGMIGLLAFAALFFKIIYDGWCRLSGLLDFDIQSYYLSAVTATLLIVISLMFWGNTHDVFGNTLTMSLLGVFIGVFYGSGPLPNHTDNSPQDLQRP